MIEGSKAGCINHPGVEATVRCKQCGTPVCDTCVVQGPTGRFCSAACKEKHQAFMARSQQLEGKARSSFGARFRKVGGFILLVAVVLVAVAVAATIFEVPVLSGLVRQVRGIIGF